jgi:hypothetical protein
MCLSTDDGAVTPVGGGGVEVVDLVDSGWGGHEDGDEGGHGHDDEVEHCHCWGEVSCRVAGILEKKA